MSHIDDEVLEAAVESGMWDDDTPFDLKHAPRIAHDIYKEMPFGMKAIVWGAGLYAIKKAFQFGEWVGDKIRGPRPPKDTSIEDRKELLEDVTKWWKNPSGDDHVSATELFIMFELMNLKPIDVIKHCEKKNTLEKESLKTLWEYMYVGNKITDEEWKNATEMDELKKLFGKDQFRVIYSHDECMYLYSVQKKKMYEVIGEHDESFTFNEVTTFDGSNEDKIYDTSKITAEDIKNLKAGKPVTPYKEPASESLYKII